MFIRLAEELVSQLGLSPENATIGPSGIDQ